MSALSQFQPDRRAARVVRPYRADCQPTAVEIAADQIRRPIQKAKPAPEVVPVEPILYVVQKPRCLHANNYVARIEYARQVGYFRGLSDKHDEPRNFDTGAEWLSWLRGWRQGQGELKSQREAEARRREDIEEAMREEIDRL